MQANIIFAKNVVAYASKTVMLDDKDIPNRHALAQIADSECVFEPEWSSSEDLRVITITDESQNVIMEDVSLEPQAKMTTYSGNFQLGSECVQIDFQASAGATQAEKDLAFFHALCQRATIDYLAIGETVPDHETESSATLTPQVVVFASEGVVRSVATRQVSGDVEACIVVDYDDRNSGDDVMSAESFEREKLGCAREEFDKSATYIW